jgi:hypothetical protein
MPCCGPKYLKWAEWNKNELANKGVGQSIGIDMPLRTYLQSLEPLFENNLEGWGKQILGEIVVYFLKGRVK